MAIAHVRQRQALPLLLKKIKFSPIVSIQGPRQCGKSFLAKDLLMEKLKKADYVTLDLKSHRDFADKNPNTFLKQSEDHSLIIDEVQKIPHLFDEMKAIVDQKKNPGQFIILGSTEFSHETQIRESLTGRLSRIRLFPLNLSETLKLDLNSQKEFPFIQNKNRATRQELLKYLKNGGLPGIFSVRDTSIQSHLFSDWLKLTVERDLHQIKKYKLESEIAYNIIEKIATMDEPTATQIGKKLRMTTRQIQAYLKVLELLFVVFQVKPFQGSTGKPLYYLTDVGLLNHLNADFEKKILTWSYLEILSQLSYKSFAKQNIYYYRSASSTPLQLIYLHQDHLTAVKIIFTEGYDMRDYTILDSFYKKYSKQFKLKTYGLYGGSTKLKHDLYDIYPWESLV